MSSLSELSESERMSDHAAGAECANGGVCILADIAGTNLGRRAWRCGEAAVLAGAEGFMVSRASDCVHGSIVAVEGEWPAH